MVLTEVDEGPTIAWLPLDFRPCCCRCQGGADSILIGAPLPAESQPLLFLSWDSQVLEQPALLAESLSCPLNCQDGWCWLFQGKFYIFFCCPMVMSWVTSFTCLIPTFSRALRPTKITDSLTKRRSFWTPWGSRTALPRKWTWRRWILLLETFSSPPVMSCIFGNQWRLLVVCFESLRCTRLFSKIKPSFQVKLDVLKPWITKRTTELLKMEDDVVVEFIFNQLEEKVSQCSGREFIFSARRQQ